MKMLFLFFCIATITSEKEYWNILTPHCLIEQILGTWHFEVTPQNYTRPYVMENCDPRGSIQSVDTLDVELIAPNVARNIKTGENGTFTLIIDCGFEIKLSGRTFLTFFQWEKKWSGKIVSYCDKAYVGLFHETGSVPPTQWGCFSAAKTASTFKDVALTHEYFPEPKREYPRGVGRAREKFRVEGARKHMEFMKPYREEAQKRNQLRYRDLPDSFDWRDVKGVNYVTPVKDQEFCGACYIFSVLATLESRAQIESKQTEKPSLSEQDIVNCGPPTNPGCLGGFPYLVGKFAREYGMVDSSCVPYEGEDEKCDDSKCQNWYYVDEHEYIGGYYGACTEEEMMLEVYNNGPIIVTFFVEEELYHMWNTTKVFKCKKHGFQEADHAVAIVGWGVKKTLIGHDKYWLIKNSWGDDWGDLGGYFMMRRGNNDCNIESEATWASYKLKQGI